VTDTLAEVDRLVTGIAPRAGQTPGVETRDAVLVTGPWLAGSTSLIAALRERLPDVMFVESSELEAPVAIVFVASAVAPLTESDCALLDLAAANTDVVIGAVSKTDVHRNWRDMLAADSKALSKHAARYRDVPWVGVAAAPDRGDPKIDELADLLQRQLADNGLARRNRLRAWDTRLQTLVRRTEEEGVAADVRMAELREQRSAALRQRRLEKSERTIALRGQVQQARLQLGDFARNRCASVRGELQEDAAGMTRRRVAGFEDYVRKRIDEAVAEVNTGITEHLNDVAAELKLTAPDNPRPPPPPQIASPPLKSRKLQTRLVMLLGAGFGLGVALTISRLFANLAPGYTIAALVAGGVVGLAATVWVLGRLRQDRAVLDRWVGDAIAELRAVVDKLVADRLLRAETALTAELAEVDEAEAAQAADHVAAIDAELREHGLTAARAAARRNRDLPAMQRALDTVRAELATHR
jgi:hypothetical protein